MLRAAAQIRKQKPISLCVREGSANVIDVIKDVSVVSINFFPRWYSVTTFIKAYIKNSALNEGFRSQNANKTGEIFPETIKICFQLKFTIKLSQACQPAGLVEVNIMFNQYWI